ncbi:hypothetical protein LTR84_005928 [Exophiala bonariae]|uniref:DUF2264 domain-containing protein n=1 Tax=Exophiala bonariae TaxID=1690606 RepID=A0AAV9N5U6_9EURO|nr:hypothetical protein LTR84_005928 [Exophiala bonariae]
MPVLDGFSDNPLQTREDVVRASKALLRPLLKYFSTGSARVRLPVASGTHFDETAAQLEGYARPLWVVGALLMAGDADWDLIQPWFNGLATGSDPDHPDYWGAIKDYDQRMVEAEMISFTLLAAPRAVLWDKLEPQTQNNLIRWLQDINNREIHKANWLWFRVFANLALIRVADTKLNEIRPQMENDLSQLDTFYLGHGWSGDGDWRSVDQDEEEWRTYSTTGLAHTGSSGRRADFYSGSFAIQFSQLLYVRFARDLDPTRTEKYCQQARQFGAGFWRFFDAEGAVIPFGRSLTYRFACAGYFAALAFADVPNMPEPLASHGAVKGFLLRHLRWWARHSEDIFYPDGTMNLGWLYPNMYMTEDYNSPQSVYWALKALIVVGLPANHLFWTQPELPYPEITRQTAVELLRAPRQILCNQSSGGHHFMLSSTQFLGFHFKGGVAKYCKFAYSSAFGFSVPTGNSSVAQIAPDNMLLISRDGTETWATKYKCGETVFGSVMCEGLGNHKVVTAEVTWHPWVDRSVIVKTTLVPPSEEWPDWHVRVHRIKTTEAGKLLLTAEGGFAISGRRRKDGADLPLLDHEALDEKATIGHVEGIIHEKDSILVLSHAGASGISTEVLLPEQGATSVAILKPEANTNLITQRTVIPIVEHALKGTKAGNDFFLITKIFAIPTPGSARPIGGQKSLASRWLQRPDVIIEKTTKTKDNYQFCLKSRKLHI